MHQIAFFAALFITWIFVAQSATSFCYLCSPNFILHQITLIEQSHSASLTLPLQQYHGNKISHTFSSLCNCSKMSPRIWLAISSCMKNKWLSCFTMAGNKMILDSVITRDTLWPNTQYHTVTSTQCDKYTVWQVHSVTQTIQRDTMWYKITQCDTHIHWLTATKSKRPQSQTQCNYTRPYAWKLSREKKFAINICLVKV